MCLARCAPRRENCRLLAVENGRSLQEMWRNLLLQTHEFLNGHRRLIEVVAEELRLHTLLFGHEIANLVELFRWDTRTGVKGS